MVFQIQNLEVPLVTFQILEVPLVVYKNLEVPLVAFHDDDVLVCDVVVAPLVVFHDEVEVRNEYNDVLLILFHYVALVGMEDALDQKTVTQVQIVVLVRNVVLVL